MSARCPHSDRGFSVSLGQIEEMSAEAEIWIDGYLAGNEPPGEEMDGEEFRIRRRRPEVRAVAAGEHPLPPDRSVGRRSTAV
jgi:hypothetical protein